MSQAHTEFEDEWEQELEEEWEDEGEDEAFFGGLAKIAGSLLGGGGDGEMEDEIEGEVEGEAEDELEGEYEDEYENELEMEFEDEDEDEAFFGGLAKIAGSLLGGGGDGEMEDEIEGEAEEFFRNIGAALRRAAPMLKRIAKVAGPLVATAVGGPAAGMLARAVTSQLEGELEAELEDMATAPVSPRQALGEYLAARAATTESEAEAEAFSGSAVTVMLSEGDRQALERLLPHLLQGAAALTRILRRNPQTRPAVRLVPGIVDSATRAVIRQQQSDGSVAPGAIGPALADSTRRVLSDPRLQSAAARRHARGLAYAYRRRRYGRRRRGYRSYRSYGPTYGRGYGGYGGSGRRPRGAVQTIRRQPSTVRTVDRGSRLTRPPRGFVRVVTPVRVPSSGGQPPRTVRVVSDVRVPRGAVPAGRPVGVAARRR
jgi:hypothetical protein